MTRLTRRSRLGAVSSAAMLGSGIAGVMIPERVATALHLLPADPRGIAEARAGLGGTYAALGCWALLGRNRFAYRAVGVTWLGAAAARLFALNADQPEADNEFWAYLAAELLLGSGALAASAARPRALGTDRAFVVS